MLTLFFALMPGDHLYGVVETPVKATGELFPEHGIIGRQLEFWKKIFSTYPASSTVIHDQDEPELLIDVVDSDALAEKFGDASLATRKQKEVLTAKYIERYNLALKRFATEGRDALKYGAIEQRVFDVYSTTTWNRMRLYKGKISIRGQGGLADTFIDAANRAQDLLNYMESIFAQYDVPPKITRLAFVESMFNTSARSKVGASGVWQFMPTTARRFMYVQPYIDERNSPYKATIGAAKFLAENYDALGSWPLAITAYNHGAAGVAKGAKAVGSRDLDRIIRYYDSPSFGFASRNFYSEFLAAMKTYESLNDRGQLKSRKSRDDVVAVVVDRKITLNQIIKNTPLDQSILYDLNQCLLPQAYTTYKNQTLPPLFKIFVPKSMEESVKRGIATIQSPRYAVGEM